MSLLHGILWFLISASMSWFSLSLCSTKEFYCQKRKCFIRIPNQVLNVQEHNDWSQSSVNSAYISQTEWLSQLTIIQWIKITEYKTLGLFGLIWTYLVIILFFDKQILLKRLEGVMFGLTYLNLSSVINTFNIGWENLSKQLMKCS